MGAWSASDGACWDASVVCAYRLSGSFRQLINPGQTAIADLLEPGCELVLLNNITQL